MILYKREKYLSKMRAFFHDDDLIKVITGIRRCGKSSLMQTIAEELKGDGVAESNIIYIDLDKVLQVERSRIGLTLAIRN